MVATTSSNVTFSTPVDCKCGCREVLKFSMDREELKRYPESVDDVQAKRLAKLESLRHHNDVGGLPFVAVDTETLFFLLKRAKEAPGEY